MKWLTSDIVLAMHEVLLNKWGGDEGGGHRGEGYEGVEAAVQAVKNSYYDSVAELGAAYAVYIVQGHVFQDGNKRTGAAAMLTFYVDNDLKYKLSDTGIRDAMIVLQTRAESGERTDQLIHWLATTVVTGTVSKPKPKS